MSVRVAGCSPEKQKGQLLLTPCEVDRSTTSSNSTFLRSVTTSTLLPFLPLSMPLCVPGEYVRACVRVRVLRVRVLRV